MDEAPRLFDNSAAISSDVRGKSKCESMVVAVGSPSFFKTRSNLKRIGGVDSFRLSHGFSYREVSYPTWPWSQQNCFAFECRSQCRLEQRWNWLAIKKQMH